MVLTQLFFLCFILLLAWAKNTLQGASNQSPISLNHKQLLSRPQPITGWNAQIKKNKKTEFQAKVVVKVFYLCMCACVFSFMKQLTTKQVFNDSDGPCCQKMNKLHKPAVLLNRIISVWFILNICSLVMFILHLVLAYFL